MSRILIKFILFLSLFCIGAGSSEFSGASGQGVEFTNTAAHGTVSFTFAVWLKTDVNDQDYRTIIEHGRETFFGNNWYGFWLSGNASAVGQLECRFESAISGSPDAYFFDEPDLSTETWYWAACTWDGTTMRMYLNNETRGTGTPGHNGSTATTGVTTVGKNNDDDEEWDGHLAHFHLYNRALSADELKELSSCPGSITNGLAMYLPFTHDDTLGLDLSQTQVNGTVTATASTDGPPLVGNCGGSK